MSDKIPDHLIAEIRDRTDIVEIVGRYVSLRRAGSSVKGLCPFHEEKTPSFTVSPSRQFFHCFGCNESGDVIAFLMKIEGKPFVEVLRDLATTAGVELPTRERSRDEIVRDSEREQCYRVNALAAEIFERQLKEPAGAAALAYLRMRALGAKTTEVFRLGYASPDWDRLTRVLAAEQVPADLAVKLGLVLERRNLPRQSRPGDRVHPDRHFDFFRDRLMFPILGPGERVLGFSGRLLDPEAKERKYVNSPESPVYRKSDTLYGLPSARPAMRRTERVILVEGNIDVLGLHQAGYEETVAPLGTALTSRQISLLRRYVPLVILLYDGDDAGRTATRKAAETLTAEEILSRVVLLPQGVDPADMVRQDPERLARLLQEAPTGRSYLIDTIAQEGAGSVEERVRAAERLAPLLAAIPGQVEREEYAREAATALGLQTGQILRMMRGERAPQVLASTAPGQGAWPMTPERRLALALLALLSAHPHLAPRAEEEGLASYVTDPLLRELLREALRSQKDTGAVDVSALLGQVPAERREPIARALLSDAFDSTAAEEMQSAGTLDVSRAYGQIRDRLRLWRLEEDLSSLGPAIKETGAAGDIEKRNALIRRKSQLSQEKDALVKSIGRGR